MKKLPKTNIDQLPNASFGMLKPAVRTGRNSLSVKTYLTVVPIVNE